MVVPSITTTTKMLQLLQQQRRQQRHERSIYGHEYLHVTRSTLTHLLVTSTPSADDDDEDDDGTTVTTTTKNTVIPISTTSDDMTTRSSTSARIDDELLELSQQQTVPSPRQLDDEDDDILILNELCRTPGITISQFMNEVVILYPHLNELTLLFRTIPTACKMILQQVVKPSLLRPSHDVPSLSSSSLSSSSSQSTRQTMARQIMQQTIRQSNLRIGILTTTTTTTSAIDIEDDNNNNAMDNTVEDYDTDDNPEEILMAEGIQYLTVIHPLLQGDNENDDCISSISSTDIPTGSVIGIYERDADTCQIDPTNNGMVVQIYNDNMSNDNNNEDTATTTIIPTEADECLAHTLQPGTNLVAAAYCYYSLLGTYLVLSMLQSGVYVFLYQETIGEFVLIQANVQVPSTSHIYRTNLHDYGTTQHFTKERYGPWEESIRQMMTKWKMGNGITKTKFIHRYMGNTLADIHAIIMNGYGGIYYYNHYDPDSRRSSSNHENNNSNNNNSSNVNEGLNDTNNDNHHSSSGSGGVPLLYVAAPLSYIMEQAGGMSLTMVPSQDNDDNSNSSNNNNNNNNNESTVQFQRVMEVSPNVVHERIPILLGSKVHIEEIIEACR